MAKKPEVTVVGAGMAGCLMSIYLARMGVEVTLLERRPDMRSGAGSRGRSINLTLATRAIAALDEVGLRETILEMTVPLKGRMIHRTDGSREYQPYGNSEHDKIYSITRSRLNIALLDAVEKYPNVRIQFNTACIGLDKEQRRLLLRDEVTRQTYDTGPDVVIGADGVFSTVRSAMQRGEFANRSQEFLDWGYKEILIPTGPGGEFLMEDDVLHIWPRGDGLLLAMANPDGTFTGTLSLPFEGATSFRSLATGEQQSGFFREQFADAAEMIPTLDRDLTETPVSGFLTLLTDLWHYKDWVVLVGDACHSVLPFYGQGMNASFEDCSYLAKHILEDDREEVFRRYQQARKRNTDALAMISKKNFVELRDSVRSPLVGYRKKVDFFINRLFPDRWVPLYTLISHSTMPYADAVEKAERQQRVLRWTGVDLVLRGASAVSMAAHGAQRRLRALAGGGAAKPKPAAAAGQAPIPAVEGGGGTWSTLIRFMAGLSLTTIVLASLAGLVTGGSRAALLAVINTAMNGGGAAAGKHTTTFVALAAALLVSHVVSRLLLIRLSQDVIFDLRMKLSREILAAPLHKVEATGTARLLSVLSDDVGSLAGALLTMPTMVIHFSTLLVCLIYLGWMSLTVLGSLLAVMALGALSYHLIMSQGLNRLRKSREDLNRLFGYFRAATEGNKELKLNAQRRQAFISESLEGTGSSYRKNSVVGRSIYAMAESWGQFLFFGYIGILLFWIAGMQSMDREALTGYTLIILYLVIPLEMLLMTIPQFAAAKVAVENIRRIGLSLRHSTSERSVGRVKPQTDWKKLELDQVAKSYSGKERGFRLGPVSLTFEPGELVFMMGGNGSGKSTFGKLLTGLYFPDGGEIRLDGEVITDANRDRYRQHFSAVFADFYLMEGLQGLEAPGMGETARSLLKRLQLDHVVEIENGVFSTTELSTGQRKRLALLTAFVEDRPFYVFDEWAADQDPDFKKIFYTEILPEMKSRGKAVLVITHDEKYAHMADRLVKLDYGRITEETRREAGLGAVEASRVSVELDETAISSLTEGLHAGHHSVNGAP